MIKLSLAEMMNEYDINHEDILDHIDDFVFKSSTLFFTVNSGLIIAIASMGITESSRLLVFGICFIGYYSSLALFLTVYKLNHYGWEANKNRVEDLEKEIEFKIGETYRKLKKNFLWKKMSIRSVRDYLQCPQWMFTNSFLQGRPAHTRALFAPMVKIYDQQISNPSRP